MVEQFPEPSLWSTCAEESLCGGVMVKQGVEFPEEQVKSLTVITGPGQGPKSPCVTTRGIGVHAFALSLLQRPA